MRGPGLDTDLAGRLTRTTFPDGSFESAVYDAEGRRTQFSDRAGIITSFAYDPVGRLTTTTNGSTGGAVTSAYDAIGQTIS